MRKKTLTQALAPIRNLFFDLDGTLVDSLPGIDFSIREGFVRCRVRCPDFNLRRVIGPPIGSMLRQIAAGASRSVLVRLEQEFRAVYDSTGWEKTTCYPGAREALESLHQTGRRCFLVTNKPLHITERIVEKLGMGTYFCDMQAHDSKFPPFRHKSEMLRMLIGRYKLDPATCLVVGDSQDDCSAALEVGMKAAWASYGYSAQMPPHDSPHCITIDSLEELRRACDVRRRTSRKSSPQDSKPTRGRHPKNRIGSRGFRDN